MPPDLWSVIPIFEIAAGLACLAAASVLWMLTNRQMKMIRRETDQRLQMLAQRLLLIESRIEEPGSHGRRAPDVHARPLGPLRQGNRSQVAGRDHSPTCAKTRTHEMSRP